MNVDSDTTHSEILRYRLYKRGRNFEPVYVTIPEFYEEYADRLSWAIGIFAGATIATAVEDVLTAGVGTADDIPSVIGALGIARLILV